MGRARWSFFLLCIVFTTAAQDPPPTVQLWHQANFPVAMVFAPDGRLFYTEKATGNVRVIQADGTAQVEPVITLRTDALVERGLIGIALDPHYAENGYIWVYHTQPGTTRDYPANAIVRFLEADGVGADPQTFFSVPITNGELMHNGGNLHFASDGSLFVSFGDFADARNAQDLLTVPGKLHRFIVGETTLLPAPDNPNPTSSIYAYGLRNTFDFTFDPLSSGIFGTENGFHCDDELNLLQAGGNYGWSADYGTQCFGMQALDLPDYQTPLLSYNPTIAPTGIIVYNHPAKPAWQGTVFFCEWNSGRIQHVQLDTTRTKVLNITPLNIGEAACRTDIEVAPNGDLVFFDVSMIYRLPVGGIP